MKFAVGISSRKLFNTLWLYVTKVEVRQAPQTNSLEEPLPKTQLWTEGSRGQDQSCWVQEHSNYTWNSRLRDQETCSYCKHMFLSTTREISSQHWKSDYGYFLLDTQQWELHTEILLWKKKKEKATTNTQKIYFHNPALQLQTAKEGRIWPFHFCLPNIKKWI